MFLKKASTVPSLGNGDTCIVRYTKPMLVHSASRSMQHIGKKLTQLQFQHPNCVF